MGGESSMYCLKHLLRTLENATPLIESDFYRTASEASSWKLHPEGLTDPSLPGIWAHFFVYPADGWLAQRRTCRTDLAPNSCNILLRGTWAQLIQDFQFSILSGPGRIRPHSGPSNAFLT